MTTNLSAILLSYWNYLVVPPQKEMQEICFAFIFRHFPTINRSSIFQPKWNSGLIFTFLEGIEVSKYDMNSHVFSTFHFQYRTKDWWKTLTNSVNKVIIIHPLPSKHRKFLMGSKLALAFSHTSMVGCSQHPVMLSDREKDIKPPENHAQRGWIDCM